MIRPYNPSMGFLTGFILILISTFGYGSTHYEAAPNAQEDAIYRELYPYFLDACSSGRRVTRGGQAGMAFGHASVFIRGIQIDASRGYPRIRVKETGPDNEVGISTNGQMSNLNWVAVPGEKLFYHGDLPATQPLTPETKHDLIERLARTQLFTAVRSSRYPTDDLEKHLRLVIEEALTIDVALAWGRFTLCQRVPLTRGQLDRVVEFYNNLNAHYFEGGNTYTWDMFRNSCGHSAQNALAAVGILPAVKVDQTNYLDVAANIVVPSNFMIEVARHTSYRDFPTFSELYLDGRMTRLLMEENAVAIQDGSLFRYLLPHGFDEPEALNQVFDPINSTMIFVDPRIFERNITIFNNLAEPRFVRLKPNLLHYRTLYARRLQAARSLNLNRFATQMRERERLGAFPDHGQSIPAVHRTYVTYLARKLAETEAKLARLP